MSLTNSFDTPATGDSYIDVATVDAALIWSENWKILTAPEKEDRIKAAAQQLDRRLLYGEKADPAQPMEFPRTFLYKATTDKFFGTAAQRRKCEAYCLALIEYQLTKIPVGIIWHSLGDETIKHTAMIEPDEAKNAIWEFWDA
jgi:hypothetical protein